MLFLSVAYLCILVHIFLIIVFSRKKEKKERHPFSFEVVQGLATDLFEQVQEQADIQAILFLMNKWCYLCCCVEVTLHEDYRHPQRLYLLISPLHHWFMELVSTKCSLCLADHLGLAHVDCFPCFLLLCDTEVCQTLEPFSHFIQSIILIKVSLFLRFQYLNVK